MILQYEEAEKAPRQRRPEVASDVLPRVPRPVSAVQFADLDEPVAEVAEIPQVDEQRLALEAAAEASRVRLEAARDEAYREARRGFEAELEKRVREQHERVEHLRSEFAKDRQRFFAAAESQVVRLALAVARKVLSHEAATDGLHLRATVKAALARVQDGSTTVLRVPETEADAWAMMFDRGTAGRVQVVGDESMNPGDCILETNIGVVELGVDAQMDEIERGFSELTQQQGH